MAAKINNYGIIDCGLMMEPAALGFHGSWSRNENPGSLQSVIEPRYAEKHTCRMPRMGCVSLSSFHKAHKKTPPKRGLNF